MHLIPFLRNFYYSLFFPYDYVIFRWLMFCADCTLRDLARFRFLLIYSFTEPDRHQCSEVISSDMTSSELSGQKKFKITSESIIFGKISF